MLYDGRVEQPTPGDTIEALIAKGPAKTKAKAKQGAAPKQKKVKAYKRVPDVVLSEALMQTKVTARKLANGAYQQKLLAFFAPILGPDLLNSIRRGLHENDHGAQRLAAEMMNFVAQRSNQVNVALFQNNQTANIRGGVADDRITSFEGITRMLQEKRQQRALAPPTIEAIYEATPED